jgi:hypothetical protein
MMNEKLKSTIYLWYQNHVHVRGHAYLCLSTFEIGYWMGDGFWLNVVWKLCHWNPHPPKLYHIILYIGYNMADTLRDGRNMSATCFRVLKLCISSPANSDINQIRILGV